jgi:hypothetical protein
MNIEHQTSVWLASHQKFLPTHNTYNDDLCVRYISSFHLYCTMRFSIAAVTAATLFGTCLLHTDVSGKNLLRDSLPLT